MKIRNDCTRFSAFELPKLSSGFIIRHFARDVCYSPVSLSFISYCSEKIHSFFNNVGTIYWDQYREAHISFEPFVAKIDGVPYYGELRQVFEDSQREIEDGFKRYNCGPETNCTYIKVPLLSTDSTGWNYNALHSLHYIKSLPSSVLWTRADTKSAAFEKITIKMNIAEIFSKYAVIWSCIMFSGLIAEIAFHSLY